MSGPPKKLLKAGWSPLSIFEWKDQSGCTWTLAGTKFSPDIVAAAIIKSVFNLDCVKAAKHHNGKSNRRRDAL